MYKNLILNTHGKATNEELNHIEHKFHVKIPEAVREHFLAYNGGYPEKSAFVLENGDKYIINYFIPIRNAKGYTVEKLLNLLRADEAIPNWLIPFADEEGGNLFCFSVREVDYGSIYYYDHEFEYGENPEKYVKYLAESIKIFIDSLVKYEDEE